VRAEDLGTVVGVWAHPDDEAYLAGGLMALARAAGSRVVCVTATSGERGTPDPQRWPPDRLAALRAAELARSLAILGVVEHHALGLPDGGCAEVDPAGPVSRIAEILEEVRPDTVLTFGPDGITGHADHRAVSAWTGAAFARVAPRARLLHAATTAEHVRRWAWLRAQFPVYDDGYPVVAPDDRIAFGLRLDDAAAARKVAALRAQASQTDDLVAALGVATYTEWVREECFVAADDPR
jgi:LmbE family N-acetylglucosaminyl deacetylase